MVRALNIKQQEVARCNYQRFFLASKALGATMDNSSRVALHMMTVKRVYLYRKAKAAKSYLELTSFSRDSLIRQLEYEGFTHEQAVYGAQANGY